MLGHKNFSQTSLGVKSHSNRQLGNKTYSTISKPGQSVGTHSPDGTIHNYSNSNEVAREPMKGVQINPPKRTGMVIEKPRKQTDSKSSNFA